MGFLAGKRLLITGLLSNRSIAYGIAKACHREDAEFAQEFGSSLIYDCDVGSDEQIQTMFDDLGQAWPEGFDGFSHVMVGSADA